MTSQSHRPRSAWDELTEDPITFFGTIIAAGVILPALIPAWRDNAVAWLLEHRIVLPAHECIVTIPYTQVGFDGRRLVIAILAVLALLAMAWRVIHRAIRRRRLATELAEAAAHISGMDRR